MFSFTPSPALWCLVAATGYKCVLEHTENAGTGMTCLGQPKAGTALPSAWPW